MKQIFLALLTCSLVHPAKAAVPRYDKLNAFYKSAQVAAQISDLDLINSDRKQVCAGVYAQWPNEFVEIDLLRYQKPIPAVPGKGPLFPDQPATFEDMIVIGNAPEAMKFMMTNRELIVKIPAGTFGNIPKNNTLSIRKKDELLAFAFINDGEANPFIVGYCYR